MNTKKISDSHIHTLTLDPDPVLFASRLEAAGVEEAVIISNAPARSSKLFKDSSNTDRLKKVISFCGHNPAWHPFYWINPMEEDAAEQVQAAVDSGVDGFKVICSEYYPSNEKAMKIFRQIAQNNKPILFHTGILWDGKASGKYTNPIEYECLLDVPKLRFAMAHVSWPWTDTAIAVYGKFLNALSCSDSSCEMFIDTTPGTPEIYRKNVLTTLYTIGYDVESNLLFGSDGNTGDYSVAWTQKWSRMDQEILREIGISEETIDQYQRRNLRRFLYGEKKNFRIPIMGE